MSFETTGTPANGSAAGAGVAAADFADVMPYWLEITGTERFRDCCAGAAVDLGAATARDAAEETGVAA
jgi:hypothetical protein